MKKSPGIFFYSLYYMKLFYCPYRQRLEYELTTDPIAEISDQELVSMVKLIRQDIYSGVSMIYDSLRAREISHT